MTTVNHDGNDTTDYPDARNDAGQLAFIVRDLMDAAGYQYDPGRPLAEQARECCDQIRLARIDRDSATGEVDRLNGEHAAEVQRLTDLVNELRKQLTGAEHRIDNLGDALRSYGADPECLTCQVHGRQCTIHSDTSRTTGPATTETVWSER